MWIIAIFSAFYFMLYGIDFYTDDDEKKLLVIYWRLAIGCVWKNSKCCGPQVTRDTCRKYYSNEELIWNIFNQEFKVVLKTPAESYIKPNTQTAQLLTLQISQNISKNCFICFWIPCRESVFNKCFLNEHIKQWYRFLQHQNPKMWVILYSNCEMCFD